MEALLKSSHLGPKTHYPQQYDPSVLFAIPRESSRKALDYAPQANYYGQDIWKAYELSWFNSDGLPQVAIAQFDFPAKAPNIIESKSFKLYLNSFNRSQFERWDKVKATLASDLSKVAEEEVTVQLKEVITPALESATLLDSLKVSCSEYTVNPSLLRCSDNEVMQAQRYYSHLLRSNCPMTDQPDWATVWIEYTGAEINQESLLQYIVSYHSHSGFGEQCVEQIFLDLLKHCKCKTLTVYGCYTRRGGLDISPYRSTEKNVTLPSALDPRQ